MQLISRLNRRLESLFEGLFRDNAVQPLDLARRLGQAMLDNRRGSGASRYAPNVFCVALHTQDAAALQPFMATLQNELKQHVCTLAHEQNMTFLGPVVVEIAPEARMPRGQADVRCEFKALSDATLSRLEAAPSSATTTDETRVYKPRRDDPRRGERATLHLLVIGGPDAGRHIRAADQLEIGRQCADPNGVLSDPNVSRRHIRIERHQEGWCVVDAQSTNGTRVNGRQIDEACVLDAGDHIDIGTTTLRVEDAP